MTDPLVTVVIPTYNRSEVREAVESVLDQTYENLEVIVVDDHSETPAEEHLENVEDERMQILRHEENRNGSAARNTGIENAEGKYIALLDDDDTWKKRKLEQQVDELEQSSRRASYTWAEMKEYGETRVMGSEKEEDIAPEILLMDVQGSFGSTLMVETEVVRKIDGFDESFDMHQDWEFLLRVLEHTEISVIKEPLIERDGGGYGYQKSTELIKKTKEMFLKKFSDKIQEQRFPYPRIIYSRHYAVVAQAAAYNDDYPEFADFYLKSVVKWPLQHPKELARPFYYLLKR